MLKYYEKEYTGSFGDEEIESIFEGLHPRGIDEYIYSQRDEVYEENIKCQDKKIVEYIERQLKGIPINVIPGRIPGDCQRILVVFCYSRGKLDERLRQTINHFISCHAKTEKVLIYTNQWNTPVWAKSSNIDAFIKLNRQYNVEVFLAEDRGNQIHKSRLI